MASEDSERGKPAHFDRRTGAVHGSGSGAGGGGNPDEDHDPDSAGGGGDDPVGAARPRGTGHPLPGSDEARHNEIPEHAEREKGRGDDARKVNQPAGEPVTPEGEPYRYDDLGRGPGSVSRDEDELKRDQGAHQDRGQTIAESEADRD